MTLKDPVCGTAMHKPVLKQQIRACVLSYIRFTKPGREP